ncbi:GTP pyrophosphokinase family protein [Ferrimonas balearica]|uniref:GTP pyrophosphokinase n=1 Tax=Ferrimonas balearica TaxID=44012 RepID=UPI001C9A1999|nr:GTP pyrophosphokinase [Ferrimonas balearica]MBY5920286.1 GTP pyrophosphokinase [Ferrimonas balearica]MBY5997029.1 GTP pyrophosphokinase [Ferrimonas balearica]
MSEIPHLEAEQARDRLVEFFGRYGDELERIRALLQIRLEQLAQAYCRRHQLPNEAVLVTTRVKSLNSVLSKLARRGWPAFEKPTDAITDLIGARVVCWFVDDCIGMLHIISASKHLTFQTEVEDYIRAPKPSGYRAIHLLAEVGYDSIQGSARETRIEVAQMLCEIQIRSKLQDAWGDMTHEFHYKAKVDGVDHREHEKRLRDIAIRLAEEDMALMAIRDAYQSLSRKVPGD